MESRLIREEAVKLAYSRRLLEEARNIIPAGASSTIRVATLNPIFVSRAKGSRIWDADGNEYIDYLLAYGALINGHCHPAIVEAIKQQAETLMMSGTPHELEIEVAKKIQRVVPNAERVLFATTGTEATLEAIRIARAVTGKTKIVKFEGAYHGHHDYVLWSVESPIPGLEIAPFRIPYYPGIPEAVGKTVIIAPWNDAHTLRKIVRRHRNSIAAIITEPIMANAGVIMPKPGYLKELKEIAEEIDALLIFDEVLTGFRIAAGGAQEYFGVKPHLATFAKALGGGVPIAAVTGLKDILDYVGPGKVGFGGTYNAHPISLAATSVNLDLLLANDGAAFRKLHEVGGRLVRGLQEIIADTRVKAIVQGLGPIFQVFFTELEAITNYRDSFTINTAAYREWYKQLFARGVHIHSQWGERIVISTAHTPEDVEQTLTAAEEAFRAVKRMLPLSTADSL